MDESENAIPSLVKGQFLVRTGETSVVLGFEPAGMVTVSGKGKEPYSVLDGDPAAGRFTLLFRKRLYRVELASGAPQDDPTGLRLRINGSEWQGTIDDSRSLLSKRFGSGTRTSSGETTLKAPMPGLVSKVLVTEGQEVRQGDGLLILEAMKMENEIKAEHGGRILRIHCQEGSPVEKNAPLFLLHYEHEVH